MSHSRQLGGYITLLQVAESTADQDYDEVSPRACRWIATKKTVKSIRTLSYRGAPGPTPDSGCLLDPIWGASGGPGLPRQIMLFRSLALGACCYLLPTGEGRAAVWLHADHSCSSCRFMGLV
ncbi:hypothetical protein GmHk_18G052002 [Glycine max]|nr:hypothetical protein GmHk_18G052002 [Glycine max]